MKTAYVRFISHELRTPLNSVFMGMQLMIDQIPEDTQEPVELERRETLVETQSACGAALDILNELLLFDKLETGALVLNKLTVPVSELVEDSIKMFSVQTREKSLELVITNNDESMLTSAGDQSKASDSSAVASDCPASMVPSLYSTDEVYVDKNKVVQVIRNVVSNAIKFTPAFGKIQVNVRFLPSRLAMKRGKSMGNLSLGLSTKLAALTSDSDDGATDPLLTTSLRARVDPVPGELVIEIKDSGAGISEANQKKLFNEVVQFHPELLQNGGGSGLGMCISKGIMDTHGGSISVYSAGEGKGSVFTLRLPMLRCLTGQPSLYIPAVGASTVNTARSLAPSSIAPTPRHSDTALVTSALKAAVPSESSSHPDSSVPSPQSTSLKSAYGTMLERPLRFLVVDDSSLNRKMLCRLLRNQGHECTEAEDGAQAVATVAATLQGAGDLKTGSGDLDKAIQSFKHAPGADSESVYDAILMDFM